MSLEIRLSDASKRTLEAMAAMGADVLTEERRALQEEVAWQLRETTAAFRLGKQPGGASWPPNYGYSPGGYAWFKAVILGQSTVQTGVVNGKLRQSISSDLDTHALVGRVGTPLAYGQDFNDGAPGKVFWMHGRSRSRGPRGGRKDWWRFPFFGETPHATPPRPFLPAEDYAAADFERRILAAIDRAGRKRA